MYDLQTGVLAVPGARLFHETRGAGPPLLLIPGGSSDAAVFAAVAGHLAARHRVLTYDPRGYSRSPLARPPDGPWDDLPVETHAEDARRLLDHLLAPGETTDVFASCAGAQTAFALARRHPGRVRSVIAHEPPALRLLPDARRYLGLIDEARAALRRGEDLAAALARLDPLFGGRPTPGLPQAADNGAFFLAHTLRPFARYLPDLAALAALRNRLVIAGGLHSRMFVTHRPAAVLAQRLGREVALFPGGHVGYAQQPEAFARRLAEVLDATTRGVAACAS